MMESINLAGVRVDLCNRAVALDLIRRRAKVGGTRPLAVASANLDHIHHFGSGRKFYGAIDNPISSVEWRVFLDGAPLVWQSRRTTGGKWERLSGSDLIAPIVRLAEAEGMTVGFLGGLTATHNLLRSRMANDHPDLRIAGCWAPKRGVLGDPAASHDLAGMISAVGPEILIVGLGKPRQELWIENYGMETGAKVLLAFGASTDFLAGSAQRAPEWVSSSGMEWAYRLAREPRRLSRRYLVHGPPALFSLMNGSYMERQPSAEPVRKPDDLPAG